MAQLKSQVPELKVVWRAYELRPDPVPTLDPHGEYLTRVWAQAVYPMAQRMGMQLKLPPLQPRSRLAHEAAAYAREQGVFEAYHEELFKAFFQRGEDIGSVDVLAALAQKVGLRSQTMLEVLETHRYRDAVLADQDLADSFGIRAVPAFLSRRRMIATGVQTLEELKKLVA